MRIVLVTAILVACLVSCTDKDNIPGGILPKTQMQSVLWDVIQAESFTNMVIKKDGSKNPVLENAKLQERIFSLHHISKEDFYKSYNYYKEHPGLLLTVLDSMTAQENKKENLRLDIKAKAAAKADSIKAKSIAKADSIKTSELKTNKSLLKQSSIPSINKPKQAKEKHKKHLPKNKIHSPVK